MRAFIVKLPRLSYFTQAIVACSLVAGVLSFGDMVDALDREQGMADIERRLRVEDGIGTLAADGLAALDRARNAQQDLLSRLQDNTDSIGGIREGAAADQAEPIAGQLAALRAAMAQIRALRGDEQTVRRTRAVETYALLYQHQWLRVVDLYGQAAHFAMAARDLDEAVTEAARPDTSLQPYVRALHDAARQLSSGRHAHDAHDAQDAAATTAAMARLQRYVVHAPMSKEEQRRLLEAVQRYGDAVAARRLLQQEIDGASAEYVAAEREIEPALLQLREQASMAKASLRARVAGTLSGPAMVLGLAWLVNAVVAAALAGSIVQALARRCAPAIGSGVRASKRGLRGLQSATPGWTVHGAALPTLSATGASALSATTLYRLPLPQPQPLSYGLPAHGAPLSGGMIGAAARFGWGGLPLAAAGMGAMTGLSGVDFSALRCRPAVAAQWRGLAGRAIARLPHWDRAPWRPHDAVAAPASQPGATVEMRWA